MQMRPLGHTGLQVSLIALGTMTFGEQNSQAEAFEQLDLAVAEGINLIDAAEMYPVPPRPETYGETERIIGHWLAARGGRDKVVLATKACGPSWRLAQSRHVRDGNPRFDRANLVAAVDASLARLQTDYIDLYQLHWPDRDTNCFGRLGYTHDDTIPMTPIEETLEALDGLVRAGKIRYIGLSNETPWGFMRFLQVAQAHGWPRVVGVQNPYSLLNRSYEIGMAEISMREHVGLLAYSPLAFGQLSGKYLAGQRPAAGRLTRWERFARYNNPQAESATYEYVKLARQHGLDPAQMALAYVNTRPFVTANIIGATTLEQLRANIASVDLTLSAEVLAGLEAIQTRWPNPAP